jgi:hypothetical protein
MSWGAPAKALVFMSKKIFLSAASCMNGILQALCHVCGGPIYGEFARFGAFQLLPEQQCAKGLLPREQ